MQGANSVCSLLDLVAQEAHSICLPPLGPSQSMNSAGNSSAGPPGPKFAQIPLPPGMTLEQYTVLQGQLGR